ncbi:hypothetical protein [Jeotgalibacillus salarius]|uniref:Uncharacterized protein n=1 Tax=Jeotgalibacillus salarius TaxID=546023 RepID=A0A4Y8LIN7_9BACL|nr:hypothetical protein [Jeotgalibacillus salarius]TFE02866.1 hypothetical protein E2626_03400 [Jeotgalibacillus salarius]
MAKFTVRQVQRAADNGVTKAMLYQRTKKGMDIETAINTPKVDPSEAGRRGKAKQPRWDIKRGGN